MKFKELYEMIVEDETIDISSEIYIDLFCDLKEKTFSRKFKDKDELYLWFRSLKNKKKYLDCKSVMTIHKVDVSINGNPDETFEEVIVSIIVWEERND